MVQCAFALALYLAATARVDSLHSLWENETNNSLHSLWGNETSITRFLDQRVPKVFFVVGLEGSGVPALQRLWTSCYIYADEPRQHVVEAPPNWTSGANWGRRTYGDVKARVSKVKVNDVYALPFWAVPSSCGPGGSDVIADTFHPDLLWVKHAVEDAEAALHVIFVNRDLKDSLSSLHASQHSERNCTAQAAALARHARYLARQLESLGGSVLSCFNYTSDADVKAEILSAFGGAPPAAGDELAERDTAVAGGLSDEGLEGMERETASLNEACRAMPKFTMNDFRQFVQKGHGHVDLLRSAKGEVGQGI